MKGRRTTKDKAARTLNLQMAIRRSGFTRAEVVELLAAWYGKDGFFVEVAPTEPGLRPSAELLAQAMKAYLREHPEELGGIRERAIAWAEPNLTREEHL